MTGGDLKVLRMRMKRHRNPVDDTTFEFLGIGWWLFHILAIASVFILGRHLARDEA